MGWQQKPSTLNADTQEQPTPNPHSTQGLARKSHMAVKSDYEMDLIIPSSNGQSVVITVTLFLYPILQTHILQMRKIPSHYMNNQSIPPFANRAFQSPPPISTPSRSASLHISSNNVPAFLILNCGSTLQMFFNAHLTNSLWNSVVAPVPAMKTVHTAPLYSTLPVERHERCSISSFVSAACAAAVCAGNGGERT